MNLTINLEQELLNTKRDNLVVKDYQALMTDIDKVLDHVDKNYVIDSLSDMGFHRKSSELLKEHRLERSRENLGYDRVFTIDQIKNLCERYNLKFLQTVHYKGTIDKEAIKKVEQMKRAFNRERLDSQDFYIAAPAESFNLQPRPKDPLLFYKLGNADNYYLIHKWGNDISLFRRFLGFQSQNAQSLVISGVIILEVIFQSLAPSGFDAVERIILFFLSMLGLLIVGGLFLGHMRVAPFDSPHR